MQVLEKIPDSLFALKEPPKKLFFNGNINLLNSFKVAIVGTRKPQAYTRNILAILASKIAKRAVVVSGGALGVDCLAHINAMPKTIMIAPSSLDIIYPKENERLIKDIAKNALILSEYESPYFPHRFSFLERNRIVIALSDIVILPEGELNSGTSSSARIACELKKPIFTLPHRYGESSLTNDLLARGLARAIYDIDLFIEDNLGEIECDSCESSIDLGDEILAFCNNAPSYEEALAKFGDRILEYEFEGLLVREGSIIRVK